MMATWKWPLYIARLLYWRNKASRELVGLLPDLYNVYVNRIRSRGSYRARDLLAELEKISTWHSNFLGLIEPWASDEEFLKIFRQAEETPGNHILRCYMLYQFLQQVKYIGGDVAEVGVYRGRTAKLAALVLENSDKAIYLFDTFEGMPEVDTVKDFYRKGDFADTSLETVKKLMSVHDNVNIYPGFFPDTAGTVEEKKFAFVHIDVDIYRSVLDCCSFFYPRLVPGGVMLFDDPGFADCAGAKLAMDEFFADKEERPIYLATAQVAVIKK